MDKEKTPGRRAAPGAAAGEPRWARAERVGEGIAPTPPDIDELQTICEMLLPWHAMRTGVAGVAQKATPADASTHRQWAQVIEQGELDAQALETIAEHKAKFMGVPGETPGAAIITLKQCSTSDRRTLALVIEQVAQGQPVDPDSEMFETVVRGTWGMRASMLARSGRRSQGALRALVEAIERAWSTELWKNRLVRWSAVHYLEAIEAIGASDRIGARETLDRVGDGPRQSWTGPLHIDALGILAGLYHRCMGKGETAAEAESRTGCGFGTDAKEGRALWSGWVEQWTHGIVADVPPSAREAAQVWNACPQLPGEPAKAADATFTTWVRGDPEWAGTMARHIEQAVDNPAWDPAAGGNQQWPQILAMVLYKRVWALAGDHPGGTPEYSAISLGAECAARGVKGAQVWIEAARSAAETIERTTSVPMLRIANASTLAGLAHGAKQWEALCVQLNRAAALYMEASAEQVIQDQLKNAEASERMSDALMEQSELIHTAIGMNESHGDDESESETQDALEDHICERRWVSAIEVAQRAAPRWPQSTEIAVARVAALAGTGLRLAAAEAFAALDAMDQASLEDIVEAGAAIEGQARESQDEEAMVAALKSHGVEVPDAALTHCATGAAHRRIEETPIAHLSATRWADAMNRAGMHLGDRLARRCCDRILRHPEPDVHELAVLGSKTLEDPTFGSATEAFERAVNACKGGPRLIRMIAAARCENLAMTADRDRGWEEDWEEDWEESWEHGADEDDEAQDNAGEDWVEPPVLCAKAALEILAEFLDCSPNAARKRFDAWKRRSSKGTRKLRSGLGQIGRWIRFGKRTCATMGPRLTHEMTVSAHIGAKVENAGTWDTSGIADAARCLQLHDEYAAWRAWLGQAREDDEPMVKTIIETPALDELAEITEAMDEKTGQDAELQRVH